MARKVGQIIARGDRRWLIRVYLGRDHETNKRNYHNRTIHGPMREAQAYLTRKLRERDLGRDLEGSKITLNEYLDRWLETAVRPRVRAKTFQDYQGMLRRYVRPILGERVLAGMRPLDLQSMYHQMSERGLSARTVRYAHVVMKSAMQQAVRWDDLILAVVNPHFAIWSYPTGALIQPIGNDANLGIVELRIRRLDECVNTPAAIQPTSSTAARTVVVRASVVGTPVRHPY